MGVLPANSWSPIFSVRRCVGGTPTRTILPVAASQTIKKGDILKFSSGKLTQGIANSAIAAGENIDNGGVSGGIDLFVAQHDYTTGASVDETNKMNVHPLDTNEIMLQVGVFGDTATSGAPGTTNTTVTHIHAGTNYQLGRYNNAGVYSYGADTETTNGELKFIEDYPGNAAADTNMRGWFKQSKGQ
jgi:hypothetical protein